MVVSWDTTRDLVYWNEQRSGVIDFTGTFFYPKSAEAARTDAGLQAWADVLMDALLGKFQLGEGDTSNRISGAWVRSVSVDQESLGEGVELAVLLVAIEVEFENQDISSLISP